MKNALVLLGVLITASLSTAQSSHVRVETPDSAGLTRYLESRGWDLMHGAEVPGTIEAVVDQAQLGQLEAWGYDFEVLGVSRPFREIQAERSGPDSPPAGYLDLAQILAEIDQAEADHPAICKVVDLSATFGAPETYEGRSIKAVKISDNVAQDEDEAAYFMITAVHCRELVTPVIALTAIERFTDDYGVDPAVTALVDSHEIWIVPVGNPDGYEYVFSTDNLWRKNRVPFGSDYGVDLNRNFPFGWTSACSGSTNPAYNTYKGPYAGSESETQAIMALSNAVRFDKVMDFHSYGEEVLWAFACLTHPLEPYLESDAIQISWGLGYQGDNRPPTADGEHYQWQLGVFGAHSFLTETCYTFQPDYSVAVAEANLVWPGTLAFLQMPIPLTGHVTDACNGAPLAADIDVTNLTFLNGETNSSGGAYGAYSVFVPAGTYDIEFSAPGYATQTINVNVTGLGQTLDVALAPETVVSLAGPAQIGTTLVVNFDSPADAGCGYLGGLTLAGTTPGVPIQGCHFPINPDDLFFESLIGSPVFSGFLGVLDGNGHAAAQVHIPNEPWLVGTQGDFGFVTYDPLVLNFNHLQHPSNAAHMTIVP